MKRLNPIEFITGFLMGSFLCFFIEGACAVVYNMLCAWRGWAGLSLAWWMLVPAPLVFGLVLGKAIASLHLEDY
jgi:ABC-type bacteriocin/lantibiotic exporter with double-glycine peptidase domain